MRRKGLLFVVALLALATLMAAMSFSSVSLKADAKLNVVTPQNGLLGLTSTSNAAKVNDNGLTIDLSEGTDQYGIQPGSTYSWNNVFTLTNHSSNTITVSMNNFELPKGVTGTFTVGKGSNDLRKGISLEPNESASVTISLTAAENADKGLNSDLNVTINAEATN